MYKKTNFPELIFENFFSGKVEAKGHMILFYPKKRIKNIYAVFNGKFKNNILELREEYSDEESNVIREWNFKKKSNKEYIGSEKNIVKNFKLKVINNTLEMNYKFKTKYKKYSFSVNIKDYMYLIDKKTIINKATISKFKVPIAETILLYKK